MSNNTSATTQFNIGIHQSEDASIGGGASPGEYIHEPIGMAIPLMAACVIAVVANGFVCYLILTIRRLKTVTNVFVFSLCLCDIMFAGVLLPVHCFFKPGLLYSFLTIIIVLIYITNLAATTYERLISITKPMQYIMVLTKSKAIRIVIFCWLLPTLYCFMPLAWGNDTQLLVHKVYLVFSLVAFLLLPFVYITYVYIKICLEIQKLTSYNRHNKLKRAKGEKSSLMKCFRSSNKRKTQHTVTVSIADGDQSSLSDCASITSTTTGTDIRSSVKKQTPIRRPKPNSRKIKRREIRASLPFAITTFSYMFTWLPVIYLTLLDTIDRLDLAPVILLHFSIFAIAFNAVGVPFIYGLLLPDFRLQIGRMLSKRKYRR